MTTPTSHLDVALPLAAARKIDRICDYFEKALQAGDRPPIEVLLEAAEETQRAPLLRALLDVELEYRHIWNERPSPEEYLTRFSDYPHVVQAAFDGDDRDPLDGSGGDLCLLQIALAQASGRRADRLRIYYRGKLLHTSAFSGPLELGRQRQGESPPFTVTTGEFGNRLVVAPLEETSVSRHHAFLEPEGQDRMRVSNLSNVNPIVFSHGRRLYAEQNDLFRLTLEMTLGTVFVRIDQPAPEDDSDKGKSSTTPLESPPPPAADDPKGLLKRLWGPW